MDAPRFLVDKTVGRLGKWLRLVGVDCTSAAEATPPELVAQAEAGGRILLSKNTRFPDLMGPGRCLFIASNDVSEQLKQVLSEYDLTIRCETFLSRCSVCNVILEDLPADAARGLVPPYVFATRQTFRKCPQCGRIYWGGTHKSRMLERLVSTLDMGNS